MSELYYKNIHEIAKMVNGVVFQFKPKYGNSCIAVGSAKKYTVMYESLLRYLPPYDVYRGIVFWPSIPYKVE